MPISRTLSPDTSPDASLAVSSSLPPLMRRFELWTVLFFGISCVFHLILWLGFHQHGHLVYPLALNTHDRFYDFTIFYYKFSFFHTAHFFEVGFPINYPAPVCLFFEFFFKFAAPHSLFFFVLFSVLAFLIPMTLFARVLVRRGISAGRAWLFCAIVCLMSWPVLLIIDGGNAEIIVWLTMLIAMWAYATGRLWLAAAFFGVAASMKLFPFVFLALFLTRKDFVKGLFGAATFLVVSVASLAILGPTIPMAYRGIAFGLASFKENYMGYWRVGENGVDHSLFALIKFLLTVLRHHGNVFPGWLHVYLIATAVGGVAMYFLRVRFMPLLNQVLTLSIACIYLTAFSGDGTLIHLYYPLGMLFLLSIKAWRDGVEIKGLSLVMSCMVVAVSMQSLLVVPYHDQGWRFMGQLHAVALGVMLVASLIYPLGPPLAEELGPTVLFEPVTEWARS